MTDAADDPALLAALVRAGVTPDEIRFDVEHGVLLSASAVRKLCACAPNREAAEEVLALVEVAIRRAAN